MIEETIAAIATPPGRGGIGMVRLSGSRSLEIASEVIRLNQFPPEVRRATLGEFFDPASSRAIDQVVVTWFRAPHSYTGEDVLEICCHGAPVVLQYLLERCVSRGARLAEPGEFTMRAFLNGRIDLTQAEAIRDLIDSRTLYQARVAAQQMEGAVSARLKGPKEALLELVASLEAGIDFAEDDVPVSAWDDIVVRASAIRNGLAAMAEGYELGRLIRDGLSLAIVGRPNVGKSSIFNRLIDEDRAIVTEIPGTTRDLVSETTSLSGIPLRLIDTAGIRESADRVERIGVEKSLQALADTDLRLLVIDASEGLTTEDEELYEKLRPLGRMVIACNKSDLSPRLTPGDLDSLLADPNHASTDYPENSGPNPSPGLRPSSPPGRELGKNKKASPVFRGGSREELQKSSEASPLPLQRERGDREVVGEGSVQIENLPAVVWVSALTGNGMPELQEAIVSLAARGRSLGPEGEIMTNLRHQECIQAAVRSLDRALEAATQHIPHEMLLLDLYDALRAIDTVTGSTTTDDLLTIIFSSFCVGK